jgi:glycosyltransferase involved in cell wall biosynthesis
VSRRAPAASLTVAVEAEALCRYPFCGIARMVVHQYRRLASLRPSWRFEFFHRTSVPPSMRETLPFVQWRQIGVIGERFVPRLDPWLDIRLPMAAMRTGADVLHCPANAGPRFGPPLVLSVLDLIPIQTEPESPHVQRWFDRLRMAARRAKRVITISEASRHDIVALLGVPNERIRVQMLAPWQSDSAQTVSGAADNVRQGPPYVLAFGSLRRNKNLTRLMEAWASISHQARRGHRLLLVGIEPHERTVIEDRIAAGNLSDAVELVGQVPDEMLASLLAGATALAYVSTIEGFGLPILEAFAAGVAVVTSRTSSMPEVAGDAALLVDPASVGAIAAALSRLLEDDRLRETLIARGRQRVTQFSWQQSAAQLCEALEESAGS